MAKIYLNLSKKEIYQMQTEISHWPQDRSDSGPERDREDMETVKPGNTLSSLVSASLLAVFLNPPPPPRHTHTPLTVPTRPSHPSSPFSHWPSPECAHNHRPAKCVPRWEHLPPPPARTLRPWFTFGPQALSRPMVPLISTDFPSTSPHWPRELPQS